MFPGMDMRKMGRMMEQMGIKNIDVPSKEVIIVKADGGKIVISSPSVTKISMQGQDSFQIAGTIKEMEGGPSDDDVKLVQEATGKPSQEALAALKECNGDIAQAIMKLKPE